MPKEHPARGGNEIPAVVQPFRRGGPPVVQAEDALSQEAAVEPVAQQIGPDRREDQPGSADGLTPMESEDAPGHSSGDGQHQPSHVFEDHGLTYKNPSGKSKSVSGERVLLALAQNHP
jgi:hypothetical protein